MGNQTEGGFSNHFARIYPDECTGCETCLDLYQMNAITMNENNLAEVNLDRCIGCGFCAPTRPARAVNLIPKPEGARRTPPENTWDQIIMMAQKQGTL